MVNNKKNKWDDKFFYEPWDASLDEPMTKEEQREWDQEIDGIIEEILKDNKEKKKDK